MADARSHRDSIAVADAVVISQTEFPADQFVLRVSAPAIAARAQPGSFAHIACDPAVPMRRPLSIMRADPDAGWVEFLYKFVGEGLRHLATRFAFLRGVLKVYEGVRVYHDKRGVTLACIGASIIAHGFLVVAWICFVNAMEIDGIPIGAMFVVVPIGMLVSSIPIGPAGIGTGHAAFLAIFALLGSNRGADLFNLVLAFQFIQAALGGMVYLTVRAEAVEVEHG